MLGNDNKPRSYYAFAAKVIINRLSQLAQRRIDRLHVERLRVELTAVDAVDLADGLERYTRYMHALRTRSFIACILLIQTVRVCNECHARALFCEAYLPVPGFSTIGKPFLVLLPPSPTAHDILGW